MVKKDCLTQELYDKLAKEIVSKSNPPTALYFPKWQAIVYLSEQERIKRKYRKKKKQK